MSYGALDEWVYFLKNSEVKDEFKAKGLKEILDSMRLDNDQKYNYNHHLDYLHEKASEALFLIQCVPKTTIT